MISGLGNWSRTRGMAGPPPDVRRDVTTDQRTITNPGMLHDPAPFGYSHAASAPGELVFIGGQYASDATGAPVPGTSIVDHDLDKLEVLGKALHARFGDRLPAQTLSGVAALALPGMLFEVDAVAVRP